MAVATSEQNESLFIGKNIPWETIEGKHCRVKHFTPWANVEAGKVKAFSSSMPYALLVVECPKVFQEASLSVDHKLDFLNLWEIFMVRGVKAEEEILVVYAPLKRSAVTRLFSGIFPKLIIYIYPKGSLEKIDQYLRVKLEIPNTFLSPPEPIAKWDARPDNLK
jgi:hypothetical protein